MRLHLSLGTVAIALACAACAPTAEREPPVAPRPPEPQAPPPPPVKVAPKPPPVVQTAPAVKPPRSPASEALAGALKTYEDGDYKLAARQLQAALKLGLARDEQVNAHKHLAFIACVSKRVPDCRGEFRKALAVDPAFDLTPAEAGHPSWGPVFRALKRPVKPAK